MAVHKRNDAAKNANSGSSQTQGAKGAAKEAGSKEGSPSVGSVSEVGEEEKMTTTTTTEKGLEKEGEGSVAMEA